ncbi:MAG: hypothetical protein M1831_007180 [Alyxoria varia]|nr:MAG: hypothetical protein M1831_007180 [Alyxoria varia]
MTTLEPVKAGLASVNDAAIGDHSSLGSSAKPNAPTRSANPNSTDTTTDRIIQLASTNSEILVTLADTREAPGALFASRIELGGHRGAFDEHQKHLTAVHNRTSDAVVEREKYQSSSRQLVYRLGCMSEKFDDGAKDSEQNHETARREQKEAEDRRAGLQKNLEGADQRCKELEALAQVHGAAHARLDALYEQVFQDPTPNDYPEQELLRKDYDQKLATLYGAKERHGAEREKRITLQGGRGDGDVNTVRRAEKEAAEALKTAARECEDVRQALELARERVFESVAGFGVAPPAYSDCCNRADENDLQPPDAEIN